MTLPHANGFAKLKNGQVCHDEVVTRYGNLTPWHYVEREHLERTSRATPWTLKNFRDEGRKDYSKRLTRRLRRRLLSGKPLFLYTPDPLQEKVHLKADIEEGATRYARLKVASLMNAYNLRDPQLPTLPADRKFYTYDVATLPADWDDLPLEEQRKHALNYKPVVEETPPTEATHQAKKPMFVSAVELIKNRKKRDYVVDGLIGESATGVYFGESGNGKTFVVLSMGLSSASGTPWAGRKVKKGLVIYFIGEGNWGFPERIIAGCKHYGISEENLSLLQVSTSLIDLSDTAAIVAEITAISEQLGEPPVMIIIDTLARHLEGDENSTPDMNRFINYVDQVKTSFPGCAALIVHHPGHGDKKRSRGAYSLKAALDFEARVDSGKIMFTKNKDGELPPPLLFKLIPIETGGLDDNGKPHTSCAVVYGECSERRQDAGLTTKERVAIRALVDASARSGEPIKGKVGATVEDWRQMFYAIEREQDPDVKQSTLRQAFNRAAESLANKGVVLEDSVFRILVHQNHQEEILSKQTFEPLLHERDSVT